MVAKLAGEIGLFPLLYLPYLSISEGLYASLTLCKQWRNSLANFAAEVKSSHPQHA
jgi:hypothetical protein